MSDDLMSRMRAAADAAISSNAPAEKPAAEPVAEPVAETADVAPEKDAEQVRIEAADDNVEAEPAEETTEEPAAAEVAEPETKQDMVDEILAVRQDAQRRVRKAEQRASKLEADLQKATQALESSKKQLVDELFKKLRRAPARTFQEYGYKFQDLIEAGMREGNGADLPFVDTIDEVKQELAALKAEREEERRRAEENERRSGAERQRQAFLSQVSKAEFPTLYAMFKGNEDALYGEATAIARQHHSQHGEVPESIAIIKYLEKKYRERVSAMGVTPAAAAAAAPEKKAQPKTLTTKAASEARSTGKPYGQLDRDQQREALLKAVQQATSRAAN